MSNLNFKIGLEVEESGIKIDDLEKKIKVFGMAVGVANKDLQAMTKTFKELGEASGKIKLNDNIESLVKTSNRLQDSLSKTKEEIKNVEEEYNKLKPKVVIPDSGAKNYLSTLRKSFKDFSMNIGLNFSGGFDKIKTHTGSLYEMSKAMLALNTSTGQFLLSMASFYTVNAAIDGIVGSYKYLFKTTAEFERLQTILNGLSNSAIKGKENFEWIKQFAQNTPFTLQETMDAFVRLKAHGLDTNYMKTYGDTAAAMGKTMVQAVEAIADSAMGQNERLLEFSVKGDTLGKKMLYTWTDTSGRAKHIIVDNNKQIIESTLAAIFNEKYAGQTEALAKTMNGVVAKFQDTMAIFSTTLMNNSPIFEFVKKVLTELSGKIDSLTNNKNKMNEMAKTFTDMTIMIIEGAFGTIKLIARLGQGLLLLKISFSEAANYAIFFSKALVVLSKHISDIPLSPGGAAISMAKKITSIFSDAKTKVQEEAKGINGLYKEMEELNKESNIKTQENLKSFEQFMKNDKTINDMEGYADSLVDTLKKARLEMDKETKEVLKVNSAFISGIAANINQPVAEINDSVVFNPLVKLNEQLNTINTDLYSSYNNLKKIKFGLSEELNKPFTINLNYDTKVSVGEYTTKDNSIDKAKEMLKKQADLEAKAKKESEKERESGLIEYYETLGNVYQSGYEKMNKYIQGLASNTKLTKSQLEEIRTVLTKNLEVETKIKESSNLEKYYRTIGQIGAAEQEKIRQETLALKLETGYTTEQQNKMNEAMLKMAEISKQITSNNTLITYFRNTGNEVKAMTLELENEMSELKKSGLYSEDQLSEMRLNKEKELSKQRLEFKAREKEELLSHDLDYLTRKGDLEAAQDEEYRQRMDELLNQDISKTEMIEREKAMTDELKVKYAELREEQVGGLNGIKGGFNDYMDDLEKRLTDYKSLTQDFLGSMESSLTSSFTTFFDATSKNFLSLKELSKSIFKSILEEIQKVIIKLIVMNAIKAAGGGFGGFFENGSAFSGGSVQAFATGTVIDTPTYFPMSGSKTGLMGEAGPEAIMPLKRDASGSLGVKVNGGSMSSPSVNVSVNNYTNSRIETKTNNDGSISIEVLEDIEKRLAARTAAGTSALDKVNNKKYNMQKQY